MTIHPDLNNHDAAWAPNGRASDVPPTGKGQNPFNEEPAGGKAPRPNVAEIEAFLSDHVGNAIHVVSIDPDAAEGEPGKTRGRYFGNDARAGWLDCLR
jgi:hypothetical protein